jgi:hypothetical protein
MALGDSPETGRPWTGGITYLLVLAILAALISILGARNPGSGAWALLMILLVVVFQIPWLEAAGRLRRAHGLGVVQLDSPWTLFYGLLVLAGITNYLPTRYGLASASLGLGLVAEYLALTRVNWPPSARATLWALVAWTFGLSAWFADWRASGTTNARNNLERSWFWFRDHWGVVWALRVQDRFNRSAELAHWPLRLTWFGLMPSSDSGNLAAPDVPAEADATLRSLIRRFVTPDRIESLLTGEGGGTCDSERPAR